MTGCSSSLLAPRCFYDFNRPRAVDRRPGGVLLLFPVAHLLSRRDIELPPKFWHNLKSQFKPGAIH